MSNFEDIVFRSIKEKINGLPSFCRLFLYESLEYCNFEEGKVELNSLYELAVKDFYVERAPGRQREIINENTLRNTIRTIKKFKGEFFKFKVVKQRIEIDMPWMRELYQELHVQDKDAGDVVGNIILQDRHTDTNQSKNSISKYIHETLQEDAADNLSININKQNKQTEPNKKALISPSFFPSDETIELAREKGLLKVTDTEEITKFIRYNQANKTRWADFNPIFITWLEREASYQLKKTLTSNTSKLTQEEIKGTRRQGHAGHSYSKYRTFQHILAEVYEHNNDAIAPNEFYCCYDQQEDEPDQSPHFLALGSAEQTLQQPFCQQVWS